MLITNLHTHTNYCDGKNTAEEMILAAISVGMQSVGISTHGPTPFESDWNIQNNMVKKYIDEVISLKKKYEGIIDVFLAMEIDYIGDMGFSYMDKNIVDSLDYYIGSVHYLGKFNNGLMWTVDYDLDGLIKGINEWFGGNKRAAVEKYYYDIGEMAVKYNPPIIGHLDLFKKNNKNNILFDENAGWYMDAVTDCLDAISTVSSVVEVNTGGISRGYVKEQYPSDWILELIMRKNIAVTVNSDAHTTKGIACKFEEMYKLLAELGFKQLSYLTKNGWQKQDIILQ